MGQKGESGEGGYRVPCVIRWHGVIKPDTLYTKMFASLGTSSSKVGMKKRILGRWKQDLGAGDRLARVLKEGSYPRHRTGRESGVG